MWNTLVRKFKTNVMHQAIFICAGIKFPYQSFQEYMSVVNIPNLSNLIRLEFKKNIEDNLFVKEIESLEKIKLYLQSVEDILLSKDRAAPITIVVQDLGLLLSVECSTGFSLAEAHATTSKILLQLRRLAKLYGISIILYENRANPSKAFESFKDQFFDYKVVMSVEEEELVYKVSDLGYNFLGFADPLLATSLMQGMPIQMNTLFNVR